MALPYIVKVEQERVQKGEVVRKLSKRPKVKKGKKER